MGSRGPPGADFLKMTYLKKASLKISKTVDFGFLKAYGPPGAGLQLAHSGIQLDRIAGLGLPRSWIQLDYSRITVGLQLEYSWIKVRIQYD